MSDTIPSGTHEPRLPEHIEELIRKALAKPSAANFAAVGRASVEWARRERELPRGSTSNSATETLVDKEEPVETVALDHLGRRLTADANGGYTVEATPDNTVLVDENDQD